MRTVKSSKSALATLGVLVLLTATNASAAHSERVFCPSTKTGQVSIGVDFKAGVAEANADFYYDNQMERVHYVNSQPHISQSRKFTGEPGKCVTVAVQYKYAATGHDRWYATQLWLINASRVMAKMPTNGQEIAEITVTVN